MKNLLFVLMLVVPAFVGFYAFSNAQSAFADNHHLYVLYVIAGWLCAAWVAGILIYAFTRKKK